MRFRRAALLAVAALAAAALAAPASASAEDEFTHEGSPIGEMAEIELEAAGILGFASLAGGVECEMKFQSKTTGPKKIDITNLVVDTKTCVTFGTYAGCKVKDDKVTKLPWEGDIVKEGATFKDATIDYTFEGCKIEKTELEVSLLSFAADNPNAISGFEVSGEGVAIIDEVFELESEVYGSFSLLSGAETYGIE